MQTRLPRRLLPALALAVVACGEGGGLPPVRMEGGVGMDPTAQAINRARDAFADPSRLRARPASAARAVADVEFLAVDLQRLRFVGADPLVGPSMLAARSELRGVLDIDPQAPPQPVIDSLLGAAAAIDAGGDPIPALTRPFFRAGASATLARLNALPPVPRTVDATARAMGMTERRGPVSDR